MTRNTYDLFRDFVDLRDTMDRMFQEVIGSTDRALPWARSTRWSLPLEIYETQNDVVVRALVPGVSSEDLDAQFQEGTLTLRATMPAPEAHQDWTWHVQEFTPGEAIRHIRLPREVDVDHVSTSLADGILTLTLPKSAEARPRQIKVNAQPQVTAGSSS